MLDERPLARGISKEAESVPGNNPPGDDIALTSLLAGSDSSVLAESSASRKSRSAPTDLDYDYSHICDLSSSLLPLPKPAPMSSKHLSKML